MLGPHFYYDIIRIARKGWPTWLRVLYLLVLLVALTVMYQAQGNTVSYLRPADLAAYAHRYAYTLIVLQNILVLVLLPVYVASAIVEEKENRTLEPLFLTHLTDHEMVLGKLGARVLHLGAVVFAGAPLLAYMHLWGNVDATMLVYHELNTFLLLMTAGAVCIWLSTQSESVFQAVSNSYPWMVLLGMFSLFGAFVAPVVLEALATVFVRALRGTNHPALWYAPSLFVLSGFYALVAVYCVSKAVDRMVTVRLEVSRRPKKSSAAMSLADNQAPVRKGRRIKFRSRIHPLALPIRDAALFWKECMKDGSSYSLSWRWLLVALGIVLVPGVLFRVASFFSGGPFWDFLRHNAYSFCYTSYFIALAAYVLVVVFQTTLSVAGEQEQATLVFLLLIPDDRPKILFNKWLGPRWRNWPILAIGYLGVLFGYVCGLFSTKTFLILTLAPWPALLMLSFLALLLSVVCRRVLFANMGMVTFLGLLLVAHVAAFGWIGDLAPFYVSMLFETPLGEFTRITFEQGVLMAVGQQALFLFVATACALVAFRRFQVKDYAAAN
jgi:ABC-type transport system involved in multi-copper enzyme maturation permease subunit